MRRAVRVTRRSISLVILAWTLPAAAAGQSGSANLASTVRDGSGSVLAGVLVVLRNPETGAVQQATTGDAGAYEFAALGGAKVPVTMGSTEHVKVLVNSCGAEYGRTGNGGFAVTTRSGSNVPRREVFYTLRPGAALDAPNFFAPRDGLGAVTDDSFRRHQAGGSAGGPIARDRIFYFADAEVTRERQDAILTSPLAIDLAPTRFSSQTGLSRLDARWNERQTITVRYHVSDYTHDSDVGFIGGLTLPSAGLSVNYRNQFGSVTHRTTIGDTAFNEIGVQLGQLRADWRPLEAGPRVIVTDRGANAFLMMSHR